MGRESVADKESRFPPFAPEKMLFHLAMTSQKLLFEDYYTMQAVSGLVELLERQKPRSTEIVLKSQGKL